MLEDNWPPKFTIDQESVLKLFTGESFYSDVDASIREAVLNAIDAIGRRNDVEPNVISQIDVVFDRQSMTVTVTDNGEGMGKDELIELFAKVGASAATIAASAKEGAYKSVGEFGIGVLSYFLVCDRFRVQTKRSGHEAIGLEFSRAMLDAKSSARIVGSDRIDQGTTLILSVESEDYFNRLIEQFPHWMRHVEGLRAREEPGGADIKQGGLSREIKPVEVEAPEWIHKTHIGPPVLFDSWESFDGAAHVDILYRGVFVAPIVINHLWAIEGAVHVDPKHFRPKLNREGFVGENLRTELEPVLRAAHPRVLERAIECVREVLKDEKAKRWSLDRWVTLWLAVPRSGPYSKAAELWDNDFRRRKAFKLMRAGNRESDVSILDLESLDQRTLYVAPVNLANSDQLVQQAVRVLRESDQPVVQGISRQSNFLANASFVGASSGDLLVNHFRNVLPELVPVEGIAKDVIRQEAVASVFDDPPDVKLVHLGTEAAPIIPVGQEIWVNIDGDAGKQIVEEICSRNEGHLGLWVACLQHARGYAQQIANALSGYPGSSNRLGPIRRRYLRELIS